MMTFLGWFLDQTPWWAWAVATLVLLASTFTIWYPLWLLLPMSVRVGLVGLGAALLAYFAGRNEGSKGANARAQAKDQANADKIRTAGAKARADSQRRSDAGGLRDHDADERKGG